MVTAQAPEVELTPSAADAPPPSDDTTPSPSAAPTEVGVQDGSLDVVDGAPPAQDAKPDKTPEPETDQGLWDRYQRSLQGDQSAGSFDTHALSRVGQIGQRLQDQQRARNKAREDRDNREKAITETRDDLTAVVTEAFTYAGDAEDVAGLKAKDAVTDRWSRVESAVLQPHMQDAEGALLSLWGDSEETRERIARMSLSERFGTAMGEGYQLGLAHGANGKAADSIVLSKADLEKQLEDAKEEGRTEVKHVGSKAPPGGGPIAGGDVLTRESFEQMTAIQQAEAWSKRPAEVRAL